MKISKLLWLISLSAAVTLNFTSCKDDDKNDEVKPEDKTASVNITVTNDQKTVEGATVYMYSGEDYDGKSTPKTNNALTYEDADKDGIAKFTINATDLDGAYKKTFYFVVFNDKSEKAGEVEIILKAGETKEGTIDITPEEEPEPIFEEKIIIESLKVKVQPDGQILVEGKISANTTIKKLVLSKDEDGNEVIVDLLKAGDQVKASAIRDAGEQQKEYTLEIPTMPVDLQTMYIYGETKGNKKTNSIITETMQCMIGAVKSATLGSYLSIANFKTLMLSEAKEIGCEVIAQSDESGINVVGLIKGTNAKSSDVAVHSGKVAFFQNGASADNIKEGGVIVTKSQVICKLVRIKNTNTGEATLEFITIPRIIPVDVSAAEGNMSK